MTSSPSVSARTRAFPPRLRALDGLRGVAAAIVVLHHISMTVPTISDAYGGAPIAPFSLEWWIVASPVKVFFAGPEFVLVFFALSGFVLTLSPLTRGAGVRGLARYDWAAYYPRRVLRLGIPVVVALMLAIGVNTLLPHPVQPGASDFLVRQVDPPMTPWHIVSEALLIVNGSRPAINPPMWSLTWEMWFSLLLPAAVVVAAFSRKTPVLWALLLAALAVTGYVADIDAAGYLPAFLLGALLAANAGRMTAFVAARRRRWAVNVVWAAVALAGAMVMISFWFLRPLLADTGKHVALGMRVVGAVLLVAAAAFWPAANRALSRAPFLWLGMISFSLYLVHSPFVVAFGLIFTGPWWWAGAVISVVVSLTVAYAMYRWIEAPSHQLARTAGARVSARTHALASATLRRNA